uniref:Uncharacterized protein n=1 Tax=Anguilla anguilla TaxID=7936 RepID=A0A0E9RS70_ANGAN
MPACHTEGDCSGTGGGGTSALCSK